MKRSFVVSLVVFLVAVGTLGQSPRSFAQTMPGGGTIDLSNVRICPKCGAINAKDVNFCKDCGYNFAAAMRGQEKPQPKGPKKEPVISWALSFFLLPGLGQFYNGDGGKGAVQLLLYGGATTMYILTIPSTESYAYSSWNGGYYYSEREKGNAALFWTGIGVASATAIWSWIDAPISASRKNRENGYTARTSPSLNFTLSPEPRNPQKLQMGLVLKRDF